MNPQIMQTVTDPTQPREHSAAAEPRAEQRVSMIVGDRLCINCGYNLTGQAVLREPHYDMLIVRCPECATVASIQEYPLLGRWANRWAAVLAALWFLFLVAFWIGSGAGIFGIAVGAANLGSIGYSEFLTQRWQSWQTQQAAQATATQPAMNFVRGVNDFNVWWAKQDQATLFHEAGGPIGAIDWLNLFYLAPSLLGSLVLGCFWATFLIGRTRKGLAMWSLAIMAVAAGFSVLVVMAWIDERARGWSWSGYATAINTLGPGLLIGALAVQAVVLIMGLMIGRPVVRWLLCILLPPRLRSPLAFLWLADGLPPPSARK